MARGPLGPTNSLPARYPPISTNLLPRQKNDLEPDARIDGTRLAHRSSGAPTRQADMENQPGPRIRQPCKTALTVASARNRKYSDPSPYFLRRIIFGTAKNNIFTGIIHLPAMRKNNSKRRTLGKNPYRNTRKFSLQEHSGEHSEKFLIESFKDFVRVLVLLSSNQPPEPLLQ